MPAHAPLDIGVLIRDHHAALYRYAYRLTGSVHDAEDLTQQTFAIAQQKVHQVREAGKVLAWLYTVLRSCYLKAKRKPIPQPAANVELDVNAIAAEAPSETSAHEDLIDRDQVQGALNALPDEFKVVVLMFYFEDRSYKEIAAHLDLPIGTVMSRLSRAKSRLRQVLAPDDEMVSDATKPSTDNRHCDAAERDRKFAAQQVAPEPCFSHGRLGGPAGKD